MGILPLKFKNGENSLNLKLNLKQKYTIELVDDRSARVKTDLISFEVDVCLENKIENIYFKQGGQLNYLTRKYLLPNN